MADFRERLDAIMDSFLTGQVPFEKFQHNYSDCYIDEQADAAFSPEEIDHYGGVHEKAEWTSASPTEEERKYGWIDASEFRTWLEVHERYKPRNSTDER
jgi:hypothetical protein